MIDPKLIERINYLANKSKVEELTYDEKEEQQRLRAEYLKLFKEGLMEQLANIKIVHPDDNDENS